jgi:integrase/recombinase XerD
MTTARHLHAVTPAEAEILSLRLEALERLRRRFKKAETRRAMEGSLRRLVRTFAEDERTIETFEWELLIDEDLAAEVWSSVATRYSKATAMRDASFLREMLRSCLKTGLMTHDQCASACSFDTKGLDESPRAGRGLSSEEVARIVWACQAEGNPNVCLRDSALILALASTGARRSEIASVERQDVHLVEGRLWLAQTKSGRPRNAWLHSSSIQAIGAWMERVVPTGTALFPPLSRTGRPLPGAMSAHQVWKIIRKRAEQAGVENVTPHDLRRFVVSSLLDSTRDLALVARVVGHSNPATTARYDRRPDAASRAAIETLQLPVLPLAG